MLLRRETAGNEHEKRKLKKGKEMKELVMTLLIGSTRV